MKITLNDSTLELTPTSSGKSYRVDIGDEVFDIEILGAKNGKLDLLIDGEHVTAYVSSDGAKRWVTINGKTFVLTKSTGRQRRGSSHDHGSGLIAPMPGLVRSVNVVEEEAVKKGQTLMVLEAMKMEIRIQAKNDGMVKAIHVKQGQTVERDQTLITLE